MAALTLGPARLAVAAPAAVAARLRLRYLPLGQACHQPMAPAACWAAAQLHWAAAAPWDLDRTEGSTVAWRRPAPETAAPRRRPERETAAPRRRPAPRAAAPHRHPAPRAAARWDLRAVATWARWAGAEVELVAAVGLVVASVGLREGL